MISVLLSLPFLLSAMSKSIDSGYFVRQVQRLGFLPNAVSGLLCVLILGILWGVAASLGSGRCTGLSIPIAQTFLVGAILITSLQTWKQNRPSCGCYGPGLVIPPLFSIIIDVALLFGLSDIDSSSCTHESLRSISIVVVVGLLMGRASLLSPIIDFSPLAKGKKSPYPTHKERSVIAFLSNECMVCTQWYPILYALNKHYPVHIISSECTQHTKDLPCQCSTRKTILTYVESFPTVVLLHHDTVQKKWSSSPPENLLEQIQKVHYSP